MESDHASRISCIRRPLARSDADAKNEENADVSKETQCNCKGAFAKKGSDLIVNLYIIHIHIDSIGMHNHAQKDIRHTPILTAPGGLEALVGLMSSWVDEAPLQQ